jgi:hypothetical protein
MQCAACGRSYLPPANFCPSCGAATQAAPEESPTSDANPWAVPAPPDVPLYGAVSARPFDYTSVPMDIVPARRRRRRRIAIGAVAAVAVFVAIGFVLNATSAPSAPSAIDAPPNGQVITDNGGVVVTYGAGHFRDLFPSKPVESEKQGSLGGANYTVAVAAVAFPNQIIVGCEDIDVAVPDELVGTTLDTAVISFATKSGLSLHGEHRTMFHEYQASQGDLTDTRGNDYTFLTFMYDNRRLYMIFAPSGDDFDSLTANFTVLR